MTETLEISLDNEKYNIVITRKRQKNMYMRLKGQKEVVVTAPLFLSKKHIEKFIHENISKFVNIIKKKQNKEKFNFDSNNPFVYIFNKMYKLNVIVEKKNGFNIIKDQVHLIVKNPDNKEIYFKKALNHLLQGKVNEIKESIMSEMSLHVDEINVKYMKSKWGYCNIQLRAITLNSQLVHYDTKVIRYVLIHELAHLVYPSHSPNFWDHVRKYCAEYKTIRKILKYGDEND